MKITLIILLATMALPSMAMREIPGQAGNDETVMADLIGHLVDEEIPGQAGNDGCVQFRREHSKSESV